MSNLPVGAKTKREQIWKHLEDGNYSAPEISKLVGTPIENVYKETSLFRKSSRKVVLTKSRKNSVVTSPSGRREVSQTEKVRLEVEANDHVSAPPLEGEALKALYSDFRSGRSASEIVANRGFHPEAVEIEERRYLRMLSHDSSNLIARIVNDVVNTRSELIDKIKEKYFANGSLDNSDLNILLKLNNLEQYRNGESSLLSAISDSAGQLPDEFVRPICCMCSAPIRDIIFRRGSHAEREVANAKLSCHVHRAR
jgi:hypothetical protein